MSSSKLTEKYIEALDESCPDMDSIWEKISMGESESDDLSPFTDAISQCAPRRKHPLRAAAAVAALFIAAVSLKGFSENISEGKSNASEERHFYQDMQEAAENADYDLSDNESVLSEENSSEGAKNTVAAVSSWNYSARCDYADSYGVLSLAPTESELATGLSGSEEYFVEENVLADTDYFLDCKIISAREEDNAVRYTVEVIHLIGEENTEIDRRTEVISHSPYALRTGREYLLPISGSNGERRVVFDNAPQIEFTADRQIVCHNGWEFSRTGTSIDYPQVYPDDFFFDRMNLTAENALDGLFEKWRKLNN